MSKIRIKNFGPIKEGYQENDGWMDIKKVTVFIGNNGSGKSTVAKLISIFTWLEKRLNRGDIPNDGFIKGDNILQQLERQRIKSYLTVNKSEIEYVGDRYCFSYKPTNEKGYATSSKTDETKYVNPKISYTPSERNFLGAVTGAFDVPDSGLPWPLAEFSLRLKKAQYQLNGMKLDLPFQNFTYKFDEATNISYISGKDHQIDFTDAASGLQSAVPLYMVSRHLSMLIKYEDVAKAAPVSTNQKIRRDSEVSILMQNKSLSNDEKIKLTDEVFAKYHNKCFINIVEEPEQNLFPTSQRQILNSLLEFNNMSDGNKLIMTTHSPYIINYLSIAIQAGYLKGKIRESDKADELNERLDEIVPDKSTIHASDVVVYELDENTGTIIKLPDYEGIPSDKNYLNQSLREGNILFDALLEIEEEL